jgi:hypothetical protein
MPNAGVSMCDAQITARRADRRTTVRNDRALKETLLAPTYVLTTYMAPNTAPVTSDSADDIASIWLAVPPRRMPRAARSSPLPGWAFRYRL